MSDFAEPGFWLLVSIVVLGASQALGAALARPHFRRLNQIAEEILALPDANDGDKSWLRDALVDSTNRFFLWAAAVAAPFFAIYATVEAIRTVASATSEEETRAELDGLIRQNAQMLGGTDPQLGAYWTDPRRAEATDTAFMAMLLSSPLLFAWLVIWVVPAIAVLILGGVAESVRRNALHAVFEKVTSLSIIRPAH